MKEYAVIKSHGQSVLVEILDTYNHPIAPKVLIMRAGNRPDLASWVPSDSVRTLDAKELLGVLTENYTQLGA